MDGYSSNSQELIINDMLQRAKSTPDRHAPLRQEALRCLINLAHSDSASLKTLAAENIRFFLNDFPDLEEEAIDAIYDLCEDSSSEVRLKGYLAITEVSRMKGTWVKRNADVLVQLLQSEEAEEIAVVKKALVEHLKMDPKATIGVLCDQLASQDDTIDDEELSIRTRLRSLVLAFMTGEVKRSICGHHTSPGGTGESMLYEGLFAAISRLELDDLDHVLQNLVYCLPPFTSRKFSERGSELLQLLLVEMGLPALRSDLHSKTKSLSATRPVLQICEHLTCDLQVVPAVDLLQFYCTSLIGKIVLQRMPVSDQQWIICSLARILGMATRQPQNSQFISLRRTIIDACPYLLEVFQNETVTNSELVKTYEVFLQACLERSKEPLWTLPRHLFQSLRDFQKRPELSQNQEYVKMLRSLSLSDPTSMNRSQADAAQQTVPSFQTSTPQASGLSFLGSVPSLSKSLPISVVPISQNRGRRDHSLRESARPVKRTRVEEVTNHPKAPTLLSRLGISASRQPSLSRLSSRAQTNPLLLKVDSSSSHGFSIKGAASKEANQDPDLDHQAPSSLLERLRDSWSGDDASEQKKRRKKRNP